VGMDKVKHKYAELCNSKSIIDFEIIKFENTIAGLNSEVQILKKRRKGIIKQVLALDEAAPFIAEIENQFKTRLEALQTKDVKEKSDDE